MSRVATALLVAALLIATGCKKDGAPLDAGSPDAAPAPRAIGTEYPAKPVLVPLAARACDALQALPGRRMSECCGGPASTLLTEECTRLLSVSLTDHVVRVDEHAVDACAKATEASLTGCDWVTPSYPPLPSECKGLIQGLVAEKGRCRSPLDCAAPNHCADGICVAPEKVGATCGRAVDQLASATRQTDVETAHPTCATQCSLVTHRCEALPEAGTVCFANIGCAPGQLCVDGKCAVGVAGTLGHPCTGTTCADGLRCVAGNCVAKANVSETCASDFDCVRGGCAPRNGGGRTCGMTCSHASDLESIRKMLENSPTARPVPPATSK